jgi:polyhydroxyalkanoate synthesis regulator phasin
MADEGKRNDPGDAFREGVRAVSGILGAFKDAIEQTFNDLSERGDISPDRAKDAARDAMKRAQDAMDDMRGRLEFVSRREFDSLRAEVAELRTQVERHMSHGAHQTPGGAGPDRGGTAAGGSASGGPGSAGASGYGAGGSGAGDGSPGL